MDDRTVNCTQHRVARALTEEGREQTVLGTAATQMLPLICNPSGGQKEVRPDPATSRKQEAAFTKELAQIRRSPMQPDPRPFPISKAAVKALGPLRPDCVGARYTRLAITLIESFARKGELRVHRGLGLAICRAQSSCRLSILPRVPLPSCCGITDNCMRRTNLRPGGKKKKNTGFAQLGA